MKAIDAFRYALSDFSGNRFKTLMSSLGIIVGVLAIVVMLTLSEGLYLGVSQALGDMQLDTMMVLPGSVAAGAQSPNGVEKPPAKLTDRDVRLLQNVPGVEEVSPLVSLAVTATYKGHSRDLMLEGVDPRLEGKSAADVASGRFLSRDDVYMVVLGSKAAESIFRNELRPGSYVNLTNPGNGKSHEYRVCGILKEQSGSVLAGDPNSAIIVSMKGLNEIASTNGYSLITLRADNVNNVDAVAQAAESALRQIHKNEAFSVYTQKMFSEAVEMIFSIIKLTLAGIGSVSLVVGGIGITNVMMLSVRERVKEIGLMKAVGATSAQVRGIFLAEALLIGLISGLAGVLLATGVSAIVGGLADVPMAVSGQNGLIGVVFAMLTTLFAGVYPAARASKLNPIDALRTE